MSGSSVRARRPGSRASCTHGRAWRALLALAFAAVLAAPRAHGHAIDATYVHVDAALRVATVDLSLGALAIDAGLDADGDGRILGREVNAAIPRIRALLRDRFAPGAHGGCTFERAREPAFVTHATGAYLRLHADLACDAAHPAIDAAAIFARVSTHRVYVEREGEGAVVLLREDPRHEFTAMGEPAGATWRRAAAFFADGVHHLLTGWDHVAFVFVLLLGVTRTREQSASLACAARGAAAVVTAFTVAHSLTLALAALGLVHVPAAPVEVAIALTVMLTALAVAFRRPGFHGWRIAFGFGLVHGLGFASVLGELLDGGAVVAPLLAFNLGIEVAQLAVAAALVPVFVHLARRRAWERFAVPAASLAVAALAAGWAWERLP